MPDDDNQVVAGLSADAVAPVARRKRTSDKAETVTADAAAPAAETAVSRPRVRRRTSAADPADQPSPTGTVDSTDSTKTSSPDAPAAEPSPRSRVRRTASAKAEASADALIPEPSTDTAGPTRKRARAAAEAVAEADPPKATKAAKAAKTAKAAAPAQSEVASTDPDGPSADTPVADQPVKRRVSRARSEAVEETVEDAAVQPVRRRRRTALESPQPTVDGGDLAGQPALVVETTDQPDQTAAASPSAPVKTKRVRGKKDVASSSAPLEEVPAPDPAGSEAAAEPVSGRRSRRRLTRDESAAPALAEAVDALDAEADASADPIGDALNELTKNRDRTTRSRRTRSAEALDDLAAAIAGDAEAEVSADSPDEAEVDGEAEGETGDGSRRRRRRRGGRRHRRGQEAGEGEDDSDEPEEAAPADGEGDSKRRRRRRRRRGEEVSEAEDDPKDVVVRVREPRSARKDREGVSGIEGSTRLEAKRQRRREGRAASRRRAPILSEAEFLARRESVRRTMLIRQAEHYSQIAVLEDEVLVEHYVDRAEATSLIGNVYLGRVQNVLPSMEAAFIDIGRGRNAVLFAGEVDWDGLGAQGGERKVEQVLSSGQTILVQVTKDPVGAKGARLTSHISIPGRYVVYAPGGHLSGISRKLADAERSRLKSILDDVVGHEASVIIRTAAEGATPEELIHDTNRLKAQWEVIGKKAAKGQAPQLLYSEPDLSMRIVRDLFTEDFTELVVDGNGSPNDAFDTVEAYVQHVAPGLLDRLKRWDRSEGDLFAQFRIDEQIAKALDRKVHLPSGGTLIIDRTEAMTVIDVNTGKFVGSGGTLEATVTANNLEAAEEIVRQLRLRDIGGIIVVDFIDMVLPSNRDLLLRRLIECLSRDRTRHQVAEVTSLGLVQMTRKRVGSGLAESFSKSCETCSGLGYIRVQEPVDHQVSPDGGERGHRHRRGRD
ncbi:MAG: Rne/Rng family ribonuclease [Propionibacteriaceae bacterium]|jgi:ribonuclease E|nr:Rne/Rng family ribonuclease [Propionibacteriaceae bacterium]